MAFKEPSYNPGSSKPGERSPNLSPHEGPTASTPPPSFRSVSQSCTTFFFSIGLFFSCAPNARILTTKVYFPKVACTDYRTGFSSDFDCCFFAFYAKSMTYMIKSDDTKCLIQDRPKVKLCEHRTLDFFFLLQIAKSRRFVIQGFI